MEKRNTTTMNRGNDTQGPKPLQSLSHGLRLLMILNESDKEMGLAAISKALAMSKPGVYRLLITLEHHGFVRQDPTTGKYSLTLQLWEMGVRTVSRLVLHQAAHPVMESLANAVGEPIYLVILVDQYQTLPLDKANGPQAATALSYLGVRTPWHATACGKCLVAFAPRHIRERALAMPMTRHTTATIVNPAQLRRELEAIRERGYAENHGEAVPGIDGLAVPVFDETGQVLAVIGLFWPLSRYSPKQFGIVLKQLMDAGTKISCNLSVMLSDNIQVKR